MLPPFALKRSIGPDASMDLDDVIATKKALNRVGAMPVPKYGLTPYPDQAMIDGLKTFQRQTGLRVDGVMNPDGPTAARLGWELDARAWANLVTERPTARDWPAESVLRRNRRSSHRDEFGTSARPPDRRALLPSGSTEPSASRRSGERIALAPALPFFVWLAGVLGVGSALVAMQHYQNFTPARQQQLRDRYARETSQEEDGFCLERYEKEERNCRKRKPYWYGKCRERAVYRWRLCEQNGGVPRPDEPDEWSDADEETGPPR